jgi:hypothetical protein
LAALQWPFFTFTFGFWLSWQKIRKKSEDFLFVIETVLDDERKAVILSLNKDELGCAAQELNLLSIASPCQESCAVLNAVAVDVEI